LQRFQIHADLRLDSHWQIFAQFEDARALEKAVITAVDKNEFDLRQAFVAYVDAVAGGVLKVRVGRQEMAFDLQRFVSVRDGPNVRQAYDAVWLDWERERWRFITFWSQPCSTAAIIHSTIFPTRIFNTAGRSNDRVSVPAHCLPTTRGFTSTR